MSKKGNGNGLNTPPKVQGQVTIEVYDNGNVQVHGFPGEMGQALNLMAMATHAIMNFFIEQAKQGDSQIIVPKNLTLIQKK